VAIVPKPGQLGTALITVTVSDSKGASASRSFHLTILPENTSPTISPIAYQHTVMNVPADPIAFSIGDLESDPDALILTASSANPVLLPNDQISITGSGANRILHLTPAPNQTGVAVVTLEVSDGILTSNVVFAFTVVPSPSVLLFEPFSYADGSVVENSGHFWSSSSGVAGETQVTGNWLEVSSVNTEDISAPLIGAPYTNSATVLYAKFDVIVRSFPTTDYGNYFAHFKGVGNSNFRGRIFATTLNAGPNACRFAIGNSTTNFTQLETDLTTGVQYTVVTKYELNSGQSTLLARSCFRVSSIRDRYRYTKSRHNRRLCISAGDWCWHSQHKQSRSSEQALRQSCGSRSSRYAFSRRKWARSSLATLRRVRWL